MHTPDKFDIIIVGGGLSGAILAWRIKQQDPAISLALIEGGARLGGNHTWCFFETDLTADQRRSIDPLVVKAWPRYSVRFPGYARIINTGYAAITSLKLHDVISKELGDAIWFNSSVLDISADSITLTSGHRLASTCIIDAMGVRRTPHLALGFQKFLALELELLQPQDITDPIIMDASVSQDDGYRFLYTLPFAANHLLIYDTYYSDGQSLATEKIKDRILSYVSEQGWLVKSILREEQGVLPIILAGNFEDLEVEQQLGAPKIGLAGILFHPTTGYSLPDAVRMTDLLLEGLRQHKLTTVRAREIISHYRKKIWWERSFFRLLNRMLYQAGSSNKRYKILERFYRLDDALIQRFYSAKLNGLDRARITIGKPPVPLLSAMKCISEAGTLQRWGNKS